MRELDTTGVPLPFECFAAFEVPDAKKAEAALHLAFGDHRVRERREFFRISPDKPTAVLKLLSTRDVTPELDPVEDENDRRALERARSIRPRFRFEMAGVPLGAELESVFDSEVTCVVAENERVLFRGKDHSLTSSALIVAQESGKHWDKIQGPRYWKFEDQTLTELRDRAEHEDMVIE